MSAERDRWDDLYVGQTEYGGGVGGQRGPVYLVAALVSDINSPAKPEKSVWRVWQCKQEDDERDGFGSAELLNDSVYCELKDHCHAILLIHVTLCYRGDNNRLSVHWNVNDMWTAHNLNIPGHGCVLENQRRRLYNAIYNHFDNVITRKVEKINETPPEHAPELGGESGVS